MNYLFEHYMDIFPHLSDEMKEKFLRLAEEELARDGNKKNKGIN